MCEHENREAAMVVLEPSTRAHKGVWCDPCLAPLVTALNCGLRTIASCCGHNHQPGRVLLKDGRTLLVLDDEWDDAISGFIHDRVGCEPGRECTHCAAERCVQ